MFFIFKTISPAERGHYISRQLYLRRYFNINVFVSFKRFLGTPFHRTPPGNWFCSRENALCPLDKKVSAMTKLQISRQYDLHPVWIMHTQSFSHYLPLNITKRLYTIATFPKWRKKTFLTVAIYDFCYSTNKRKTT